MNSMHKKVVLVPGCLIQPDLQAQSKCRHLAWPDLFREFFQENEIEVVALPCPESTFENLYTGIGRKPHGVSFYENLDGFTDHCLNCASKALDRVHMLQASDVEILAVLGIEHSPTCAVNYMYTHMGTVKRSGIFLNFLKRNFEDENMIIPFIGINRRFPRKAMAQLQQLL